MTDVHILTGCLVALLLIICLQVGADGMVADEAACRVRQCAAHVRAAGAAAAAAAAARHGRQRNGGTWRNAGCRGCSLGYVPGHQSQLNVLFWAARNKRRGGAAA